MTEGKFLCSGDSLGLGDTCMSDKANWPSQHLIKQILEIHKKSFKNKIDNLVKLSSLDKVNFSYFHADFTLLCTGFQIKVNKPLVVQVIVLPLFYYPCASLNY